MHTLRHLLTVACGVLIGPLAANVAHAEWNPTPIAVPLIGTSGPASPYPSTIMMHPPGGALTQGYVLLKLHAVTHPCPKDLAVLLVHDHFNKYLMMSDAGGCSPMQGTDIWFEPLAFRLPNGGLTGGAPWGDQVQTETAAYLTDPVFPAPAPPGPYSLTMPHIGSIQGQWDLYVIDMKDGQRGVIAGGWSLSYVQEFASFPTTTMPVEIPDVAPAARYPITWDLTSQVTPEALVRKLRLYLNLSHPYADDVRVVLQSPSGASVIVMANAGGNNPLSASQQLFFTDESLQYIPDDGPLPNPVSLPIVDYKPGSAYELAPWISLPGPAPPAPYATEFAAFTGEPVQGVWKLWVYDDLSGGSGFVTAALLDFDTNIGTPTIAITQPTTTPTFTATQPFVQLTGVVTNVDRPFSAHWRNVANGEFYDEGSMTITPGGHGPNMATVTGTVSLKKGTNVVRVRVVSEGQLFADATVTITVNEFTYSLTEGATGGFFDEDVTMGNPSTTPAAVRIDFLQEGAPPITHTDMVPLNGPLQLHVDDLVPPGAVSTIVHSTDAIPLAVERTMSWDSSGYGGSGGTAITPNTLWLFAEGSQGYFDTYLLLANDNDAEAPVVVRFLLEGGGAATRNVNVPAHKRVTIYAGDIPELVNRSFGMEVVAGPATPITAERAMYFPHSGGRLWEGGHEAAGVNGTSTHWYLAEGATGPFFECFVLLSNPSTSVAHTTLTYLLSNGDTISHVVNVPANGRSTINIETVDERLANAAVSTIVSSDVGIIVERSMYWPDIAIGWREAHNSPGVVDPALRWGVSDVRVGGTRDYQTYILLANPNPVPAEVQVRLLRPNDAPVSQTYSLPPTSRTNVVAATLSGAAGTFSAEVQVLNYQPIVVEKALYWNAGPEIWAAGTGVVATPLPPR